MSDFYSNRAQELKVAVHHIIDEFAERVERGTYNAKDGLLGIESYQAKYKLK